MAHVMFMQKVKPEKRDEYIKVHRECWPELLKAIKESGIERELIWMNGNDILVYMMAENFNEAMKNLNRKEIFKKWLEKMDGLMDTLPDFDGGVKQLENVFDLENQLE